MRYYIADCHFFHGELNDQMDCRGFADTEEMNNYMLKKWNAKVRSNDEVVILGAFGCGAFENDPEAVAAAFSNVIARYRRCFKTIELAIYCSPRDEQNYNIFKHEIDTILC